MNPINQPTDKQLTYLAALRRDAMTPPSAAAPMSTIGSRAVTTVAALLVPQPTTRGEASTQIDLFRTLNPKDFYRQYPAIVPAALDRLADRFGSDLSGLGTTAATWVATIAEAIGVTLTPPAGPAGAPAPRPIEIITTASPVDVETDLADGTYTVVNGPDDHVTLRVRECRNGPLAGRRILSVMTGTDNETGYLGMAFVVNGQVRYWRSFTPSTRVADAVRTLFAMDQAGRREAGHAYALQSGRCCRCGRLLTVPASIHAGMGPECAKVAA